jgi:alpha-glucosidase
MTHSKRNAVLFVAATVCFLTAQSVKAVDVTSPDGQIQFRLLTNAPALHYEVSFRGRLVIERSALGIWVDNIELSAGAMIAKTTPVQRQETYPARGIHRVATNHFNGADLRLKHRSGMEYILQIRSFDNGVAFRHVIPKVQPGPQTPNETTLFRLPQRSIVWHHGLNGHYEDVFNKSSVGEITNGVWIAPPLTFKLPDSAGYAAISEAALWNYSGMALKADGKRGFQLTLGHQHPISYPFRLRYSNDVERVSLPATVTGEITSPWRVIMVGADLNTLVNSDLVSNLCPPTDPDLFPQGVATDWVKPGRAVWKYLDGGANSFDQMKDFSRWAGELGFEYHVIEGFWSRWSDEQIKELVDYSRERGVGLWFWRHSRELRTPEAQDAFFDQLHRLGVVGAKIDFFDHEHKDIVDLYTALLEKAAQRKILVNFHGANKPTGESRTWPNEMIRESVRGMEASRLRERALHNVTLPFTRYLIGHGDYTPVHFGARRGDTTWTHQIATAAVFNEPLLTYGAHPTNLLQNPALEMIKQLPPVWDETIVLPPSEIGEVVVFARRARDAWFLAVLNGPEKRELNVPLSFLPEGGFQALLVQDDDTLSASLKLERRTLRPKDSLTIQLPAGGGYIGRFARP